MNPIAASQTGDNRCGRACHYSVRLARMQHHIQGRIQHSDLIQCVVAIGIGVSGLHAVLYWLIEKIKNKK